MKKATKDFLITSIPSLLLILLMILSYIFNPRKIFDIGGGIAFIMLAHPFYLIVRELKAYECRFLKGLLKIWIFLLPYLWLIDKYDGLSIGVIIPIAEYGFATELWGVACLHKNSKDIKPVYRKKTIKLLIANVLPFVVFNLLMSVTCFWEKLPFLLHEAYYIFCFILNLISEIFFGLFGAYYYFKINSMLLGEGAKVATISTAMIVLFAISQYFIYSFEDMDFKWFVIKYIYLLLSCTYFAISTCLRGKSDKDTR